MVAQQFDDIVDSQHVLRTTLLVTYPLLLLVLALIASRVIAAALRPVEALRSTAERISGAGQETRLPVPESRDEIHDLAVTLNSMLDRLARAVRGNAPSSPTPPTSCAVHSRSMVDPARRRGAPR